MRLIAVSLAAAFLAAGAAYANGRVAAGPTLGTMTCHVRPDTTLVFGRQPVADCTFTSDRGGPSQSYLALFSRGRDLPRAQTVTWRVSAPGETPDLLAGRFALGPDAVALAQVGGQAVLKPMEAGRLAAQPALMRPQVQFAAVPALASR